MTERPETVISVAWLNDHLHDPGLKIIDVRPIERFLDGHIPGALSLDIMGTRLLSSAPDAVAQWESSLESLMQQAGIEASDTMIAYEDFSGTSSAYAVWLGDVAGVAASALVDGGFNAWLAAGYEVTGDATHATPSEFQLTVNRDVVATAQSVAASLSANGSMQIVDTRTDQEFSAATIPGAKHLEWTRSLTADGLFRPFEEIRADYVAQGIDLESDAPIATFCGSGLRAANAYVVLKHLGVRHPQNYGPSWSEWGRQPGLPKQ
ncbi:MAG: rhodanese-like domain-containing protein, partial [Thermomicrobiales bacterium]